MRDPTRFGLALLAASLSWVILGAPPARGETNETARAEPIAGLGVPQLATWSPLQLSFSPDGKLMVANASQPPSIWNVADGRFVEQIESPKDWRPRGATFTSDDELLCFGVAPPRLAVADVRSGRLLHEPGFGQKSLFNVIASPRSNALLIVGERTELWSLSPMKRIRVLVEEEPGNASPVERITGTRFSSDGSMVLVTRRPGDVLELWEAKSGERLPFSVDLNPLRRVPAVASVGGRFVATFDETLRLYETAEQREIAGLDLPPNLDRADVAMAFAPSGDTLAVTAGENLFLIDPAKGITARSPMPEKSAGVFSGGGLFWSPDGTMLLVHAASGRLMRFSHPALQSIDVAAGTAPVIGVAISSDGRAAYSLDRFGKVRKWDVPTSRCTQIIDAWTQSFFSVPLFALSHDEKRLIAVSPTGSVRLFNADDLSLIREHELQSPCDRAEWSVDATRLVVASQGDVTVSVFDVETGDRTLHIKPPMRQVSTLDISPDGEIICAAELAQLFFFSIKTGERLSRIRVVSDQIRFLDDDHLLATRQSRRALIRVSDARIIWQSDRSKPVAPNLPPAEFEAREIPRPARESEQLTITIGLTQTRLRTNDDHLGGVRSYAASTHGRYVATGGMDGQVLVYDLARMLAKKYADDLQALLDDLGDPDARVAVGAIAAIAVDPALHIQMAEHFRTQQEDRARFERLIAKLSDADVSQRDAAHRALEVEATAAATAIADALADDPSGEFRDRLESLSRLASALTTRPARAVATVDPLPDVELLLDRLAIAGRWAGIEEPPATQPAGE